MSLGNTPWTWCGLIKGNCGAQEERAQKTHRWCPSRWMQACQRREQCESNTMCCMWLNPRKMLLTAVWLRISSASPVKIISIMLILLRGRRSMNPNWTLTMLSFSERSLSNAVHLISAVFLRKNQWEYNSSSIHEIFQTNSCKQAKITQMIPSLHSITYVIQGSQTFAQVHFSFSSCIFICI